MTVILVGVDGSDSSRRALRWAAAQAEAVGGSLRVVMAWDNPGRDMWVIADPPGTDRLRLTRNALQNTVRSVLGEHPSVPVDLRAVEGPPARELVREAADADLLVVGSRGHGGFTGVLIGSVSLHCVSHAPCPVVVVRDASSATN